jgi:hypothetical protein
MTDTTTPEYNRGAMLGNTKDWEGDQYDVYEHDVFDCLAYIKDCGNWEDGAEFEPFYDWCNTQDLIDGSDDDWRLTDAGEARLAELRVKLEEEGWRS